MNQPRTVRIRGRNEPVIGERRIGRRTYFLLRRLSQQQNDAYLAFDPFARPGGGLVALHVLPRSRATEQRIKVLDRLARHGGQFPGVAAFERQRDGVVLALDWVEGENLRGFLKDVRTGRAARPSIVEATRLIAKLAHGLAHLHGKANCVHGDIKPANLILARAPLRLVLVDFGSAWPVRRTVHRDPGDGATAPYAAPEQLTDGQFVDWRADIFGLAIVWYELLTLQIPYDGMGGRAGLAEYRKSFAGKLQVPSAMIPDRDAIPADILRKIDSVVCRGLALNADERFSDRRAWLDELDAVQSAVRSPAALGRRDRWLLSWLERLFFKRNT